MSQKLISLNNDLRHLQAEGYSIEIVGGWLITYRIPYLNARCQVQEGQLYIKLLLSTDNKTLKPNDHVAYWIGDWPCDKSGENLVALVNQNRRQEFSLCKGLKSDYMFSFMPERSIYPPFGNYPSFYEYVRDHVNYISAPAYSIDKNAAKTVFEKPFLVQEEDSVLRFPDTNSSRANLTNLDRVFDGQKIAIIGLGGTGSYILDKVAKMPVKEIILIDGDDFNTHNAYRAPGVPMQEDWISRISKVSYFGKIYGRMHKGIVIHDVMLSHQNLEILDGCDFAFLAIDAVRPKNMIADYLISKSIPFVDSGLGIIKEEDGKLSGSIRVTTATPKKYDHLKDIFGDGTVDDDIYHSNIQIAVLNSLAADLSVIKWLKMIGYLGNSGYEYNLAYDINLNKILYNEDN
jgi:molybdopterin/thiamine biosynthesis adenylyltransferase